MLPRWGERPKAQIRRVSNLEGGEKAGKSVDVGEDAKAGKAEVRSEAPTSKIGGAGVTNVLKRASGE